MRRKSKTKTAIIKDDIQGLVRQIVMKRDKGCILRHIRHCGGEIGETVIQADHLITRANSATYADTRLIVCICRACHGWKHWHEKEYDATVRKVLSPEIVKLWDRCEADHQAHKTYKMDWVMEKLALEKELKTYD